MSKIVKEPVKPAPVGKERFLPNGVTPSMLPTDKVHCVFDMRHGLEGQYIICRPAGFFDGKICNEVNAFTRRIVEMTVQELMDAGFEAPGDPASVKAARLDPVELKAVAIAKDSLPNLVPKVAVKPTTQVEFEEWQDFHNTYKNAKLTVAAGGGGDHTTFSDAVSAASSGDAIYGIEAGTYSENINASAKALDFVEDVETPRTVIIQYSGNNTIGVWLGSSSCWDGFDLDGQNSTGSTIGLYFVNTESTVIKNTSSHHAAGDGIFTSSQYGSRAENSLTYRNGGCGIKATRRCPIIQCTSAYNTGDGICGSSASYLCAIGCLSGGNTGADYSNAMTAACRHNWSEDGTQPGSGDANTAVGAWDVADWEDAVGNDFRVKTTVSAPLEGDRHVLLDAFGNLAKTGESTGFTPGWHDPDPVITSTPNTPADFTLTNELQGTVLSFTISNIADYEDTDVIQVVDNGTGTIVSATSVERYNVNSKGFICGLTSNNAYTLKCRVYHNGITGVVYSSYSGTDTETPTAPTRTWPTERETLLDVEFYEDGVLKTGKRRDADVASYDPDGPAYGPEDEFEGELDLPDRSSVDPLDTIKGLPGTMDLPAQDAIDPLDTMRGVPGSMDLPAQDAIDPLDTMRGVPGSMDLPAQDAIDPLDTMRGVPGSMDLPAQDAIDPLDTMRGVPGSMDLPAQDAIDPLDTMRGVPGSMDLPLLISILDTDTLRGVAGRWIKADKTKYLDGQKFGVDGESEEGELEVDEPDPDDVLLGATTGGEDGTVRLPAPPKVENKYLYGPNDSLEGTLVPSTDPPAMPTWSASPLIGDQQITLYGAVSNTEDVLYIRYKKYGTSVWLGSNSRTGSGAVVVDGLTNGQPYVFVAYASSAGIYSLPSVPQYGTPVSSSTPPDQDYLKINIAVDVLKINCKIVECD